jgi:hypothetical protein
MQIHWNKSYIFENEDIFKHNTYKKKIVLWTNKQIREVTGRVQSNILKQLTGTLAQKNYFQQSHSSEREQGMFILCRWPGTRRGGDCSVREFVAAHWPPVAPHTWHQFLCGVPEQWVLGLFHPVTETLQADSRAVTCWPDDGRLTFEGWVVVVKEWKPTAISVYWCFNNH